MRSRFLAKRFNRRGAMDAGRRSGKSETNPNGWKWATGETMRSGLNRVNSLSISSATLCRKSRAKVIQRRTSATCAGSLMRLTFGVTVQVWGRPLVCRFTESLTPCPSGRRNTGPEAGRPEVCPTFGPEQLAFGRQSLPNPLCLCTFAPLR